MLEKNRYRIYISSKCKACNELMHYIKSEKINVQATNVDEEEYSLPFAIMMFPALVAGNKLIGYGNNDIIAKLKQV